ncbi:MAG TPA: adenosylcobinamide-GDP ribazoletransferase [Jatrophihabitans sp.]|nr:adenosylcobinamide-GDP ribazoletransferase [Jatrophihabitans sp.]
MTGLRRALALFTVAPVRLHHDLTRAEAGAALRWLPLVGAAVGAVAGLPSAAVLAWAPRATLLGCVLTVVALALLTRGLHLDGLADTADGLGSRAVPEQALAIMRRSDIGPFGVITVLLVLLVDVAALVALSADVWQPLAAVAVAAATGRVAALWAAHRGVPSARPHGFGAYVAGSVSTTVLMIETVVVLGFGVGLADAVGASLLGWPVAQLAAVGVCIALRLHITRRLGGVTGDVFGALIEIGTAATLVGLALS